MPHYEYECSECKTILNIEHSIKRDAIEYHKHDNAFSETCDGKLKRLISKVNHIWKNGPPTPKNYI